MLYKYLVDKFGNVEISPAARFQYEVIIMEIEQLCNLTFMDWDLTASWWPAKIRKLYFVLGTLSGVLLTVAVGLIIQFLHAP